MTPDGHAICAELKSAMARTGWCEAGRRSGHDRSALYRAFTAHGKVPSFRTVTEVAEALGYRLQLIPPPTPGRDLSMSPDGDGGYDS